ncbi:MAG: class I SAM-dependent methyltransferase [Agarilytica sp.]
MNNVKGEVAIKYPVADVNEDVAWVKERFRKYNFRMPVLLSRLGIEKYEMWANNDVQVEICVAQYLSKKVQDELDILTRVFALSSVEQRHVLKRVFSEAELNQLVDMDVLIPIGQDMLACEIALLECDGLLMATDSLTKIHPGINRVMPLLAEVYEFDAARVRGEVNETLDLCSGSGIHGLLASRHSTRVTCVDNNPRAIAFSRFNLLLNGIDNVDILEGDLYSCIEGKLFDLILANPPYVPTEESLPGENHYSGGPRGDAISSRIIQGLPKFLRKNGICQIIHLRAFDNEQDMKGWLRENLLEDASQFGFLVLGRVVEPMTRPIENVSFIEWGITNISRLDNEEEPFYHHAPYTYPLPYDIEDLFDVLLRAADSNAREKAFLEFTQSGNATEPSQQQLEIV